MAALVIAAAALALGYQSEVQAPASTYALLPGTMSYEWNKPILYWNMTHVAKVDDETEVELLWLERMRLEWQPAQYTRKYRVECEWRTVREYNNYHGEWSDVHFIHDEPLLAVANQVCGSSVEPLSTPRFAGEAEVFDDAATRLGYESGDAARRLQPSPPMIVPGAPVGHAANFAPREASPQTYQLAYGPDADRRAVFLKQPVDRGGEGLVSGTAIWMLGIGHARDHAFALRSFQGDCTDRTIALTTTTIWSELGQHQLDRYEDTYADEATRAPQPGDASGALLQAACDGSSGGLTVSSLRELDVSTTPRAKTK